MISQFYASAASFPKGGGTTVLHGAVSGATSCTLAIAPTRTGYPATLKPCASISKGIKLPANMNAAPKYYTFTLTAKAGTLATKAVAMAVVAGTKPPVASITLPATLAKNTELSPKVASVYLLPSGFTVPSGFTLVVAPGTVVKAADTGASVSIAGALNAVGTSASPITFTSIDDNAIGGSTGSGSPTSNDWGGISVGSAGRIDLEYANISYNSYGVVDSGGPTTIANNAFAAIGSQTVITVNGTHLNLSGVSGNTAPANSVVGVTGTLTTSSTLAAGSLPWLLNGGCLFVPAGVTLTVQAGAVIKAAGYGCNYSTIDVAGTLNAVGTSVAPITFTSINDNTVGGATGSGSSTTNDWSGFYVESTGSIDLEHANVSYASGIGTAAVRAYGTSATILNDTFSSLNANGVDVSGGTANVSNNQFTDIGANWAVNASGSTFTVKNNDTTTGPGYSLSSAHLNFANVTGNTGPDGASLVITGDTVTTSSTMTAEALPWTINGNCLDVPSGVTLTVQAGAVVKSAGYGCNYTSIEVDGTLVAVGTSLAPITFTSINDNSIGGTTGSGTPGTNDWSGLYVSATGSIDLEHANIAYASGIGTAAVRAYGTSTTILNDTFSSLNANGVDASGGTADVSNNQFTDIGNNWAVNASGDAFTVKDNDTTTGPGYSLSSSHLNFANVTGNTGPAGASLSITGDTVTTSSTMTAEALPWTTTDGCLYVPAGVTLTVQAGAVLKAAGYGCNYSSIEVSGTLVAVGTSLAPITFTSLNDNTVGGATGSGSPSTNDWAGFYVDGTGSIDLEYATVEYASGIGTAAVRAYGPSTTILDNTFSSLNAGGVDFTGGTVSDNQFGAIGSNWAVNAASGVFTVQDNHATSGLGYNLASDNLDLDNVTGNTGPAGSTVSIGGTVTTSSTLTAGSTPWLLNGTCLYVPSGVTLTVQAGAVVKASGAGCSGTSSISVDGTLDAVGTSGSPITFTSINDNTVGGNTGNGSPQVGDWGNIRAGSTGVLNEVHCVIKYATP